MKTVLAEAEIPLPPSSLSQRIGEFSRRFGHSPTLASWAPGRVNLIGEHTDYNGGFVLPAALPLGTLVLAAPRTDKFLRMYSDTLQREGTVDLSAPARQPSDPWLDYAAGVAHELVSAGYAASGADALVWSNLPLGSGLSSSAAFEMAVVGIFEGLGDFRLNLFEAALLGQRVENSFLGLSSGIMDQFAVRGGEARHALFLDCQSLAHESIPVNFKETTFVVADTASPRRLVSSEYNQRVSECGNAVSALKQATLKQGDSLRKYSLEELEAAKDRIPPTAYQRARHVLTENKRTLDACDALREGDAARFGALMDESHASLRDDYEVSSDALELFTHALRSQPGCLGARLTGAGFGGCAVALFEEAPATTSFDKAVLEYRQRSSLPGTLFKFTPSRGQTIVRLTT